MRIALISDIHGNAVALDIVLDALKKQQVDSIICLGDVAASGPQPCQVIERLRAIGCPVVMGNTDDWLLQPQLKDKTDDFSRRLRVPRAVATSCSSSALYPPQTSRR